MCVNYIININPTAINLERPRFVPGDIVPLTSDEELRSEGKLQHNCVGTLSEGVRNGYSYYYRVLQPERATLSITKGSDGCWWRAQLKLDRNKPPGVATINKVEGWLGRYRVSL